jgi:hypothetical protein
MEGSTAAVYLPMIVGVLGLIVIVAGASADLELAAVGSLIGLLILGLVGTARIVLVRGRGGRGRDV